MMENNDKIVILNTDDMEAPKLEDTGDIFSNRGQAVNQTYENKLTIVIQAYNRIDKLRNCIKYYQEYTSHIEHDLFLVDNGSEPEVLELFKSIEHPNKTIYRVTKNIGALYPAKYFTHNIRSEYYVLIADDAYVTKNWLDNLFTCIESDEKIARVVPMSSNMSNMQDPGLRFNSLEEMQEKAAKFNHKSDPTKWQERIRSFGVVVITRMLVQNFYVQGDLGFYYDFSDDDGCLRIARAGYKQIVCGDTFIHHDHYHQNENDPVKHNTSLQKGRECFVKKYYGLDAWVDLLNYEISLINLARYSKNNSNVLGIDCLCGIPLLEIRNRFKAKGHFNTNLYAFTTQAKHYHDLLFVTEGKVQCDRVNYINDYYPKSAFDVVILGEYINKYPETLKVLETALDLLVPGGQLLVKLKNTLDVKTFLALMGSKKDFHKEIYTHLMVDDFMGFLSNYGVSNVNINHLKESLDYNSNVELKAKLGLVFNDVVIKESYICITK